MAAANIPHRVIPAFDPKNEEHLKISVLAQQLAHEANTFVSKASDIGNQSRKIIIGSILLAGIVADQPLGLDDVFGPVGSVELRQKLSAAREHFTAENLEMAHAARYGRGSPC